MQRRADIIKNTFIDNAESVIKTATYPKYFAVLVVAVLPGVVLPGDSEQVAADVGQTRVVPRLHLLDQPVGEQRLVTSETRETLVT